MTHWHAAYVRAHLRLLLTADSINNIWAATQINAYYYPSAASGTACTHLRLRSSQLGSPVPWRTQCASIRVRAPPRPLRCCPRCTVTDVGRTSRPVMSAYLIHRAGSSVSNSPHLRRLSVHRVSETATEQPATAPVPHVGLVLMRNKWPLETRSQPVHTSFRCRFMW